MNDKLESERCEKIDVNNNQEINFIIMFGMMRISFIKETIVFFIFFLSCSDIFENARKTLEISSKIHIDYRDLDIQTKIYISQYDKGIKSSSEIFEVQVVFSPLILSSETFFRVNIDSDFRDPDFFVPGVWIKGNRFSLSKPYSPLKGKRWIFREDRLPVPVVMAYSQDGKVLGVLKVPGKFDKSYDPDTSGPLLYDTDIAGLGFDGESGRIIITFPAEEYPIIYRRKLISHYEISSKETKAYLNSERRMKFFIIRFSADTFSQAVSILWKVSYDIYKKEGLIQKPFFSDVLLSDAFTSLQEYFRKYFFEGHISGFYSFVETKTGRIFMNLIEAGFTGMAVFNGANSIFLGYRLGQPDLIQIGRKVINSWIENAVENGFFWDCYNPDLNERCDLPPFFFKDSFFTRRNFETLLGIYLAYKYEQDEFLKQKWFSAFLSGVHSTIKIQKEDGSFSRRYDFSGNEIEREPSGTYFSVPVFVKAYEETSDQKFLQAAISAGDFIRDMVEKYHYYGSTIDANSEDKEASIWAFISCYLIFKLNKEQKFKDCAEKSLYSSLFWFFLWNVPFSPDQDFYKIGLSTLGLSSVSVENIHVDVYLFFFPRLIRDFADSLSTEDSSRIKDFSDIMVYAATNIIPTFRNTKGAVLGIVPEVIQQTWWDYGFGGKGTYNITSATGWTVASVLSALKNYFIYPDL